MSFSATVLDRLDDVIDLCRYLWLLPLGILVNLLASVVMAYPAMSNLSRRELCWVCGGFLAPSLLLVLGSCPVLVSWWWIIGGIAIAVQLAVVIRSMIVVRGFRWLLFSIGLCHLGLTAAIWIATLVNSVSGSV